MVETIQKPATFEIFDWDGVRFFNSVFEPLLYLVWWLFPILLLPKQILNFQVRIDHRTKTVHFGTDLAEAQSHDLAEGPHLQDMPSEQVTIVSRMLLEIMVKKNFVG